MTVTIGTPSVASGAVTVSSSATIERSYTTTSTNAVEVSQTFTNTCAGGYICTGQASAYEGTYDIPYTATIHYVGTSTVSTLTGTYKGTTLYSMQYQ